MVVIKLQLNNDIRRVNVSGPLSFKDLHELAKNLFEGSLPKIYFFKYKDDEGDLITVSSDRELEEAFRIYKAQDILRLIISVPEKPQTNENKNTNSSQHAGDFFDMLQKLVGENGFIRDLLNNLEVEIFSTPNSPKPHCGFEKQVPQAEVVHSAICDGCESQIKGIRYKCTTCPDYDLCQTCLAKNVHPDHEFVEILRPSRRGCPMRRPDFARGPFPHNAICDGCDSQIVGIRYKCKDCPDYDLCEKCYSVKGIHNAEHKFDSISRPACPWRRQCGNANSCHKPTNQADVIHPATCDGCHQRIRGLRYKCNNCIDYDLCQSCKDKNVHSEHTFTTLSTPVFTPPGWKPESAEKKPEEPKSIPVSQPAPQVLAPLMKVEPVPVKVETPAPVKTETPVVAPKVEPKVEAVAPKPEPVKVETPVPSAPKVTPPASPVVPKLAPAPSGPFEAKLKQLEEMGFPNRVKNIEYLVKRNGDMILVVKDLLEA